MRLDAGLIAPLADRFEELEPLEILRVVAGALGRRAAILCSMQRAEAALCHMADRAGLGLDVVFVDTGVLFPHTLATRDRLAATHPNLHVRTLAPERSFDEQTREEGVLYLTKDGQERCCDLRKSAPLRAIKGQYDVLLAPLRRDEGGKRASIRAVELDPDFGVLRVHPFAKLTRAALDAYLTEHPDAVVNPLHAMGFPTNGCFTCTTPVREDEDARAGRWRHLAEVAYCGIHPTDRGAAASEVDVGEAARALFAAAGLAAP
jgi:phosphoadenosine phosphosulfate reductase